MTFQEYRSYDALGLAELVRKGDVQAIELLDIAIQRAEAINPKINALVLSLFDMGKKMAGRIDKQAPFAGTPYLIKDLGLELAGTRLTYGSKAYAGQISETTSYLLQKAEKAGLVFMAKTNTPELGLTPFTEPKAFGPTRNPWDTSRSAGGSSGGSAAAVAAGISPIASASDGGGSIRIPAANCGLFGFMPSRGRMSLGPAHGEMWMGAVREHCVTRSVRDSAAMLDILNGYMPGDPYGAPSPIVSYQVEAKTEPGKLRIAVSTSHVLGQSVDPECLKAVSQTAQLLHQLGHEIVELKDPPYRKEDLTELFLTMVAGEAAASLREMEDHLGRKLKPSDVEGTNFAIGLLGKSFTAAEFAYQIRRWNDLSRRMAAFHEKYDLLLSPVVSMPPFPIGALQQKGAEAALVQFVNAFRMKRLVRASIDKLAEETFSYIPFTPIANMTGQPSMSVPLYWTPDNLPVGSMFTAAYGREDLLFRLAGQLEQAQPWMGKVAGG
ncbi:MAG: amidase [Haliscomenobacter sp.]|nr:amidase [Haliscomenobacter sp.]